MTSATTLGTPLSGPALVCGAICALMAAGMIVWGVRYALQRQKRRARFMRAARERGFGPEEAECLWWLGGFSGAPDRLPVLGSVADLDECLRNAETQSNGDLLRWPTEVTDSMLSVIRRRLSGTRRTPWNIVTTRQLDANQPLRVRLTNGAEFDSFVVEAVPEALHLTVPLNSPRSVRLTGEQPVHVSFWRPQDARYEFSSRSTGLVNAQEMRLDHAEMVRVQQRERVRVRCRDENRVAAVDRAEAYANRRRREMPEGSFSARLRDLSAGGAAFYTARACEVGGWLLLRFKLHHTPGAIIVPARILRVTKLEGTSESPFQVSVKFEPLAPQEEHHLSRLVADVQRALIRRMLARTGAEAEPVEPDISDTTVVRRTHRTATEAATRARTPELVSALAGDDTETE